jgi:hypothetical protein
LLFLLYVHFQKSHVEVFYRLVVCLLYLSISRELLCSFIGTSTFQGRKLMSTDQAVHDLIHQYTLTWIKTNFTTTTESRVACIKTISKTGARIDLVKETKDTRFIRVLRNVNYLFKGDMILILHFVVYRKS